VVRTGYKDNECGVGDQNDSFVWSLTKHASFTVKSMYSDLMKTDRLPGSCVAWDLNIPLKIKKLWYLRKGVVLTKDNLAKRNWKGDTKCCFCNSIETIQYLFFDCHVARFVWNAVYVVFGIQPPTSISSLLCSWLGNFSRELQKQILVGALALCWAIWL
jgi:hypothetical protein